MRTNKEIAQIAEGIYAEATAALSNLASVKKAQVEALLEADTATAIATIKGLIADIESVLKAPRVDEVGLPAYLSRLIYDDNNISTFTVSVRTKLKSDYKYRKDTEISLDENIIMNIGKAYVDALFEMFYIEEANTNIAELNSRIAEVIADNEIGFNFKFAVANDSDAVVLAINNDEVIFNADISKALDIASLAIFKSGDEYNDLICKEAIDKLVASLKAIQTPVQLIKANVGIIKDITGISTKKRASKLIRGSYHRQAKYLGNVKAGVGYYEETVNINGEDTDVFALVSKAEDGTLEVVLNPFDVKTLFNVEYDVIEAVKAQMA